MRNSKYRLVLSAVCLASILAAFTRMEAAPIRFDQVTQITNPKPGKAEGANFARLEVTSNYAGIIVGVSDDDEDKKKRIGPPQDGRVITETRTEIVEEEDCDCEQPPERGKFPKWALLGLAAIPIAFILIKRKKDTPTPTATFPTTTPTPPTQTPTPKSPTPTPTPKSPTPTPPITPTPTPPEPVPEPMTILLFGTGLASVGLAARRRFGKKSEDSGDADEEL